jgi:uracil-DNA glycosylase
MTISGLTNSWQKVLETEFEQPYFQQLQAFLVAARQTQTIFPAASDVFAALNLTSYENVKVLILGQDPYHNDNQAHGLCFSVNPGIKVPPSLANIYKELRDDLDCQIPNNGYLVPWAEQGILMLNAVLTVQAHTPNSHKNQGWEKFTDTVIAQVNRKSAPVIFVLWSFNPLTHRHFPLAMAFLGANLFRRLIQHYLPMVARQLIGKFQIFRACCIISDFTHDRYKI